MTRAVHDATSGVARASEVDGPAAVTLPPKKES
jgi:hypothetical protein